MRRLFFAGVMLFAGCSGSTGPKMAELSELPTSIPVRTLWRASGGDAGDAILFPALAGDGVYAAAPDGTLARFEAASRRGSWGGARGGPAFPRGGARRAPPPGRGGGR